MTGLLLIAVATFLAIGPSLSSAGDGAPRTEEGPDHLFTPQELRADLQQLYNGLQEAAFNLYAFTPKGQFDQLYAKQIKALDQPLTRQQALTRFELFAAAAHMGHTRVDSPVADWTRFTESGGKSFPLRIRIVDGRVYVAQNLSGIEGIRPGEEILALNGEPMHRWLTRLARHISAETDYMAHSIMEEDFARYLWIELGAVESFEVRLRQTGTAPSQVHLPARSQAQIELQHAKVPPVLDLEDPARTLRILGNGLAYLRPGPFYNIEARTPGQDWDVSGFQKFIDRAFGMFISSHVDRLIIDLRNNPGGDNLFSDVMVAWFADRPFRFASQFKVKVSPEAIDANEARMRQDARAAGPVSRRYAELYARARIGDVADFDIPQTFPRAGARFTGKVFVLVNRQTYSNAVAVAALVQDYRFGSILGETTSDMASTYGAMEKFSLRNTGLIVRYPKARIIRPSGDARPAGVTPDIPIRTPIVETADDAVLAQAVLIARER